MRRQRDDFAHKLSDKLTKENKIIVFEDLRIGNMVKNHNLASAIMDAAWGKLRLLTAYKAERRGGRVILVEPKRDVAEMLWMRGSGSEGAIGKSPRLPEMRAGHGQGCERRTKHPEGWAWNRPVWRSEPLLVQRRRISKFAPMKQEARDFSRG